MNREERVLKTIMRDAIDYLPSQIYFASLRTRERLQGALGLRSQEEFEAYLDNHLYITAMMDDVFRYHENPVMLQKAIDMGFARLDPEDNVVYDRWGIGISHESDGLCIRKSPLNSEEKIRSFRIPEPDIPGNFSQAAQDLEKFSGDQLVICAGYLGIFEKCWMLMGFDNFMMNIALQPKLVESLLDKITEYKIQVARNIVKLGFKCAHTGDDFGTQKGLLISREMWRKYLKPRLAQEWEIFKSAGLPIIHHSFGNITEIIPDMIDIGLDVLEPVQPVMDLKYLKNEFGKDLVFYGGIDTQELLPYGQPADIREMAAKTIHTLGKGGGMIISPSQEIMSDVPLENVVALVRTILEERILPN